HFTQKTKLPRVTHTALLGQVLLVFNPAHPASRAATQTWRMKDRMKAVSVSLVLCLNVGVDPPDVVKTTPCCCLECWIDPPPPTRWARIGTNLQKQYECWQPRARYKQCLDPTVEEVKKLCMSLRRNAKEGRVLVHCNVHGVPRPTANGEVWVFNKNFTQYIPLFIYHLLTWMGSPSIFVYDCSHAGIIVKSLLQSSLQREQELETVGPHRDSCFLLSADSSSQGSCNVSTISPSHPLSLVGMPPTSMRCCVQPAACESSQLLPMNPELPADLFTSCLTTPVKISLRCQSSGKLVPGVTLDLIEKSEPILLLCQILQRFFLLRVVTLRCFLVHVFVLLRLHPSLEPHGSQGYT
uniref:Regulatory-associated protein of mTOR-like n=1 Tax=Petromyzon marinus TaxID=7757 RepID=A0AAJ7TJ60_PETMA